MEQAHHPTADRGRHKQAQREVEAGEGALNEAATLGMGCQLPFHLRAPVCRQRAQRPATELLSLLAQFAHAVHEAG